MTTEEKFNKLKSFHAQSHPSALKILSDMEQRFIECNANKEWFGLPETQKILTIARDSVKDIHEKLISDPNLNENARQQLFGQKAAHMAYISFLSDPIKEINDIDNWINFELTGKKETT